MRSPLAAHMDNIPFAGVRRALERAVRLEETGARVIHFEIGRPDFDTPAHIREQAKRALDEGLTYYAPNRGLASLREAIAGMIAAKKGVSYDPGSEILVTAGGQEAIYLSVKGLLDPGDEVLVPNPGFGPFRSSVLLAGGVPVAVPPVSADGLEMDLQAAESLITERSRAIIINSPHNPTGNVATGEQLEQIALLARKHDLFIISDEAYDHILYNGIVHVSPASLPGMRDRTIMCGSLSKTYAMTGWRIGYVAAPAEFIQGVVRVQQNVMLSVCSFAQAGAVAALTGSQDCVRAMVGEFDRRREAVVEALAHIPGLKVVGYPRGTFYVFVRHTACGMTSARLGDYLLEEGKVAVVDGGAFGSAGEGCFRISYATSYADCQEGMDRIGRAMRKLAAGQG